MAVTLAVTADGAAADSLVAHWRSLTIALGQGETQDTAALTLAAVAGFALPAKSAALAFAVDGAELGTFQAKDVEGDTRQGTLVIHAAAVNPESSLRKPRDRTWEGQTISSILGTIASEAGLAAVVEPSLGSRILAARVQIGESDLAFARRLVADRNGRLLVQEGRLIATTGDRPGVTVPPLRVDLRVEGAWARWRRGWSDTLGRAQATYLLEDGVSTAMVEVGAGDPVRQLQQTFTSREDATAAATGWLSRGSATRDQLIVEAGFLPAAQVLQPLEIAGGEDRIPAGLPGLVVHQVRHRIGSSAATTTLTAGPAAR